MGELLSVSEAEGEHLAALGSFESFPFRLLIAFAATFPISWGKLLADNKKSAHKKPGAAIAIPGFVNQCITACR